MGLFWRWHHNEGMFWKFRSPLAGPGPQPIDRFYWLKVLLKTRSKSASIQPLIDLIRYLQPKLWVKKTVFDLIQNFSEKAQFALLGQTLASYNSAADWARELFKPSADSASFLVDIEKKRYSFSVGVFWRWRHNEGMFWKFWSPLSGPGPQPIDPFY